MEAPNLKKLKYLSPTSYMLFQRNREEFWFKYMVGGPRDKQTKAMAYGSAFDAKIKSHLAGLLGIQGFEFDALFRKQVEPHNQIGEVMDCAVSLFEAYVRYGCVADLLVDLERRLGAPRMEYELNGIVSLDGEVPLSGRPDLSWNLDGVVGVLDWKVNGMDREAVTSPKSGYLRIRPGGAAHKDVLPLKHRSGVMISSMPLNEEWAIQVTMYGWLLGVPVGEEILACIDQLVGPKNKLRVAQHRAVISREFQLSLWEKVKEVWEIVNSDWFFRDLTQEQSIKKCESLSVIPEGGTDEEWLSRLSRQDPIYGS